MLANCSSWNWSKILLWNLVKFLNQLSRTIIFYHKNIIFLFSRKSTSEQPIRICVSSKQCNTAMSKYLSNTCSTNENIKKKYPEIFDKQLNQGLEIFSWLIFYNKDKYIFSPLLFFFKWRPCCKDLTVLFGSIYSGNFNW